MNTSAVEAVRSVIRDPDRNVRLGARRLLAEHARLTEDAERWCRALVVNGRLADLIKEVELGQALIELKRPRC